MLMRGWIYLLAFSVAGAGVAEAQSRRRPAKLVMAEPSNAELTVDLYQRLAAEPGNLFFSPLSVGSALSMTYAGARGETAAEMAGALHLSGNAARAHADYAALKRAMDARCGESGGKIALSVANALWYAPNYAFKSDILELISTQYGGAAEAVDFARDTSAAIAKINGWVAGHTQQRIKDLLSGGDVPRDTKMILTNAVYFKAPWETQFSEKGTADGPFTLADGGNVTAKMMRLSLRTTHAHIDQHSVVELPYAGRQLAMMLLVPDKADGLAALEKQLSAEMLRDTAKKLESRQVLITMPKFRIERKYQLRRDLEAMGLRQAFTTKADFTGMTDRKPLFIGAVIHQTFLDVDEQGTEAAAATAVTMRAGARMQEPIEVKLDHPFLLLIWDRPTGTILFMGRVSDPTARA